MRNKLLAIGAVLLLSVYLMAVALVLIYGQPLEPVKVLCIMAVAMGCTVGLVYTIIMLVRGSNQ